MRKILSYTPGENRVTFDELHEYAIYPDGRNHSYAIYNSINALSKAGEYHIITTPDSNNKYKILLWPRDTSNLENRITYSVRNYGINIGSRSNISIEGFHVRKHSGSGLRDGVGIGTIVGAYLENSNLSIKNNLIEHNGKGGGDSGYGGIFLENIHNTNVDSNIVSKNPKHRGIFLSRGENNIVQNK